MKKCAVIDLGTNIFHLLIAQAAPTQPNGWVAIGHNRIPVHLAEEGIEHIGPAAFQRGLDALHQFHQQLRKQGVTPEEVRAFGTAALRTAQNASAFLQAIERTTGIRPQVISGQREAELIFKGVRQAVPFLHAPALIMDIGGGSVEFILAEADRVYWQQSFPIGTTALYHRFHKSDPIAHAEINALREHVDAVLADLWQALHLYPTRTLIGAAGAFDTLDELLNPPVSATYAAIERRGFEDLYPRLVASTLAERSQWPGLKPERRLTIVVGMVLIQHLLQRAHIREIFASRYSLKEGAIAECFQS